jgi:PDZ domain-containing protein
MTRRASTMLTGILLLAGLIGLTFAHVPVRYVALIPGPTFNTLGSSDGKELITISGAPTTNSAGQLRMLTVLEQEKMTVFDVVRDWIDPKAEVIPREILVPPGQTQQQVDQTNTDEFQQSQNSAITAALRHEGYPVQVTIDSIVAGKPADGHLKAGDIVTSVDGKAVLSGADLAADVQAEPIGSTIAISYTRAGVAATTQVKTVADEDGKPQIGVKIAQKQPSPLTIKFALANVGGPSAGLMFSLGIIDKLDPTDLTGGRVIAGTGTIDDDGSVGAIGGIAQKEVSAHDAGARYFLAPAANCAEALKNPVKGLTLIKVTTLDGALSALAQLRAGQAPPLCTK